MLIRLWWKEGRSLLPIAAILVVAAVGLQWFLLAYGGREIRNGVTVLIGLGWATVYACVAGSASFAGERENRTMGFLDALPVGRSMLWLGKVTFVLLSSLVLALLVRTIGFIGWRYESVQAFAPQFAIDRLCAVLIIEATLWGIFWSSLSKNAITAGLMTVVTTMTFSAFRGWFGQATWNWADFHVFGDTSGLTWFLLLTLATGISWLVVNREIAPGFRRQRSAAPLGVKSIKVGLNSWALRPVFGPYPAFWSLVWQTRREGRSIWWQVLGLTLLVPILTRGGWRGDSNGPAALLGFGSVLAVLIYGTSVFGIANAAGTRQFLDSQAVSPRTVWLAKVAAWGGSILGLGAIAAILILLFFNPLNQPNRSDTARVGEGGLIFGLGVCQAFTIGMVCGMICNRRITAALLALLSLFLILLPQVSLVEAEMIPAWSLMAVPLSLLMVSFCWAGPWLANRGGWRRWAGLAGLLATPLTILILVYTGGRAWGIPDVGPQYRSTGPRPGISVGCPVP